MKRLIPLLFAALLVSLFSAPALAAVKEGSTCTKLNSISSVGGYKYTCIKSGKKLLWSKGVKVTTYTVAFAKEFLAKAELTAEEILESARIAAIQNSMPPNCTTSSSKAFGSVGVEAKSGLRALVFENRGVCDLIVSASASFLCPDGKIQKISNFVSSTGIFSLKASEKLFVSPLYLQKYFPQVFTDCRLLTGYSANSILIDTYHEGPRVVVISSKYSGVFNQAVEKKKANELLKSAQAQALKIIADAKNPTIIEKAWKVEAEAIKIKATADLAKSCIPGSRCLIGSTGPGGGQVFYDAGIQQSWGQYLEVAPSDWYDFSFRDPEKDWCNLTNVDLSSLTIDLTFKATLGEEIGKGKANTKLMLDNCKSGAAFLAQAFDGGGKSDWYLPSKDELNELCKFVRSQPTGKSDVLCTQSGRLREGFQYLEAYPFIHYWSSSERGVFDASWQNFTTGHQDVDFKMSRNLVRPIRSF